MATFSSKNTQLSVTSGAAHVALNGNVTSAAGSGDLRVLSAAPTAGSGDGAEQFVTDATGWKVFSVDIANDVSIAAGEALLISWSTSANDEAALTAKLDTLRTTLVTPDASQAHTNCAVITGNTKEFPVVLWDGTNRIKTISVASQATATYNAVVSLIV